MRFRKIHVVINPASGQNEPILNTLNDVFAPHDIQWDVSITHNLGDGKTIAERVCGEGVELVMAYGGDGTQLDVAMGLIDTGVPLGILPGGTANALADELGVPNTLQAAAQLAVLDDARLRAIDIARANEQHFLLRAGTGMVGTFSESVSRELKDRLGIMAYVVGGVRAIANPPIVNYTLEIDGEKFYADGTACLVNNGNAIGALGVRLNKNIHIDDGLLDVFVVNNDIQSIIGVAGSLVNLDQLAASLQHWQGQTIRITADPVQKLYADGEETPIGTTPITIDTRARALTVLTPPLPTP